MRAGSPLVSFLFLISGGAMLSAGCFIDASPYGTGTGSNTGGGTTTIVTGGGGTTSTTVSTGGGGTTVTTTTTGGGGTGGTMTTGGGGTGGVVTTGGGGTGGTMTGGGGTGGTGPVDPESCTDAMKMGKATGPTQIDPDGAAGAQPPLIVYCDQTKDGGGWALVYSSVGDPGPMGQTAAFWKIQYTDRFTSKGQPNPMNNYYGGMLYKWGVEYRDDFVDISDNELLGVVRAQVDGIDEVTMAFMNPNNMGSFSDLVYDSQFAKGWSSSDQDYDPDSSNCSVAWGDVTQHYDTCWKYNLGVDEDNPKDDGGWGPHTSDGVIDEINNASPPVMLVKDDASTITKASRLKRISRFTRW